MTAEPKYGPWIAWNATPDSTCPPDAVGKAGEVDCLGSIGTYSRVKVKDLASVFWTSENVLRYRVMIEPVRGEVVFHGLIHGWTVAMLEADTHTLRLPTVDGALIPGTYTGPDGAVIKVEAV